MIKFLAYWLTYFMVRDFRKAKEESIRTQIAEEYYWACKWGCPDIDGNWQD